MPVGVGGALTLADVVAVARGAAVEFPDDARARVEAARAVVERAIASGDTIYGVTTGFGSLADVRIDPSQAAALQLGIVRSHATAVGRPLSREEARAMLLLRAHVLALGYSGVRPLIVDRMVEMLNRELIPVGAGAGFARRVRRPGAARQPRAPADRAGRTPRGGRQRAGGRGARAWRAWRRSRWRPKEGLALVNGTQGMLAVGILAARRVADLARAPPTSPRRCRSRRRSAPTPRSTNGCSGCGPHAGQVAIGIEPASAARRLADPGVASREPAPGAGRVLAAVRAAGARRHP